MTDRFTVTATLIPGLAVIERKPVGDHRGFLDRLYSATDFAALTAGKPIVQANRTVTLKRGALRGMHFQHHPHAETKIVTCLRGEVYDVAVDLRRGSRTFLQWHAEVLSGNSPRSFVIPEGFAHGFQTLKDDCEMLYLHTAVYAPESEGGVNALDPLLGIRWPVQITEMSTRDSSHPALAADFEGVRE